MNNQTRVNTVLDTIRHTDGVMNIDPQWSDVLVAMRLVVDDLEVINFTAEKKLLYEIGIDLTRTPEQNMQDSPELLDFLEELLVK